MTQAIRWSPGQELHRLRAELDELHRRLNSGGSMGAHRLTDPTMHTDVANWLDQAVRTLDSVTHLNLALTQQLEVANRVIVGDCTNSELVTFLANDGTALEESAVQLLTILPAEAGEYTDALPSAGGTQTFVNTTAAIPANAEIIDVNVSAIITTGAGSYWGLDLALWITGQATPYTYGSWYGTAPSTPLAFNHTFTVDPFTTTDWTVARVKAMDFGIKWTCLGSVDTLDYLGWTVRYTVPPGDFGSTDNNQLRMRYTGGIDLITGSTYDPVELVAPDVRLLEQILHLYVPTYLEPGATIGPETPTVIADATGAGDVVAQLNALLAELRVLGLIG